MSDIAFVRREMLPPQAPPGSAIGPVRWARENLFSSWLNAILTILSVAAVCWLVAHIWPWFAHSVWNAELAAGVPPDHRRDLGRGRRAAPASR